MSQPTRRSKSLPDPDSGARDICFDADAVPLSTALQNLSQQHAGESYERLVFLHELTRDVCSQNDLERVLETGLDGLERLFHFERCFVAAIDSDGALRGMAERGIHLPGDFADWPVSKTIVNRVLNDGVALLSSDASHEFAGVGSVDAHSIRSVMCAPLGRSPAQLGLIYADNTVRAGRFSDVDLSFLTLLSHFLYLAIRNALDVKELKVRKRLSDERYAVLQHELLREHRIVGTSAKLMDAYEILRNVAPTDLPILLLGENGTGKELFAKAAHKLSDRANGPFMPVNIAALSENLVESELFGHEAGAFTGADRSRAGRFELAEKGTLFLDEIAEIPLHVQVKLLRVLESRSVERVGSSQPVAADVRLICATNKDLNLEVEAGRFRQDLYFRINGVTISLCPLRERRNDIPQLVEHVIRDTGASIQFDRAALQVLQAQPWPGNVRQLITLVRRIMALCKGPIITADEVREWSDSSRSFDESAFPPLSEVVARVERQHIARALELTSGNKEQASKSLGIAKGTLYSKMRQLGLK